MGKNSLISGLRGPCTAQFPDGTSIRFNTPDFKLGGTIMGTRTIDGVGTLMFEDMANQLRGVIILGTFKSSGFFSKTSTGSRTDFTGIIYKVKPAALKPTQFGKTQSLPEDISKLKDVQRKVCELSGNWLHQLIIGGQPVWNVDSHQVTR